MAEIDEEKEIETVNKAYKVLSNFLSDDAGGELSPKQNAKIVVSQTVINNHSRRLLAKARVISTYVGIAQTVLDDPDERKKYLAYTVPGFVQSLPEAQRPEEIQERDKLAIENRKLKESSAKLVADNVQLHNENSELKALINSK